MNHPRCQPPSARPGARASRAFSLIELVASLAIFAVLMTAIGSTVLLASRAIPEPEQAGVRHILAARILERIAADLETAVDVRKASGGELEFVVADRDGDGSPEVIRYRWRGGNHALLDMRYNGGSDVEVLANVTGFDIKLTTDEIEDTSSAPLIVGPEVLVAYSDQSNASIATTVRLNPGQCMAEAFVPDVGGAAYWRPTRAFIRVNPVNPRNETINVVIRPATLLGPDTPTLALTNISENDLVSNAWFQVNPLASAFNLSANRTYFICLEHASGNSAAGDVSVGILGLLGFYQDTGLGWSLVLLRSMRMYVYGTPMLPDPDWVAPSTKVVTRATLSLTLGDSPEPIRTAVALPNRPDSP